MRTQFDAGQADVASKDSRYLVLSILARPFERALPPAFRKFAQASELQRGDGWWLVPSPGQTKIKGVPKMVPLNGLAYEALFGKTPRIGGRFFHQWKDGNSFKHTWMRTCERAGVHDLHFRELRHTFTTWLTQCGVDYAVIQTLKGEPLPDSAKYYIHNLNVRLRDAVTRLEAFVEAVLSGENDVQLPLQCHLSTWNNL